MIERKEVEIVNPTALDVQLVIAAENQVVNVEAEANSVSADTADNGDALVLGEKQLAALSDDPDELSQQLQALAGPGGGPDRAQIYIDGFTGVTLPPKSSIREVRINSNPSSPEYDRPGFGHIQIFTKPGTDNARNTLNHPNYAAPNGDLISPYFGQSLSLAGFGPFGSPSTYNRKIDLQLRLTF